MRLIHFVIVDRSDRPIYQQSIEFKGKSSDDDYDQFSPHQVQLIFFSSLDVLDDLIWSSNESYFKTVEVFNKSTVSAFVGCGGIKFMLLRDTSIVDYVREFFLDVYEIYIKAIQNPLQTLAPGAEFDCPVFASRVSAALKHRFT